MTGSKAEGGSLVGDKTDAERVNAKRLLVIAPSGFSVVTDPASGNREVAVHLHIPDNQLGMAPGVELAYRMSPAETRRFATILNKMADEAEAGLLRS